MPTPSDPMEVQGLPALYRYATIANGESLSSPIDLGGKRLTHIAIPAAWTAANLTFQVSVDGRTFGDLYDAVGTEYTATVGGASRTVLIPFADFIGAQFIKIRSGTTGSAVAQGAARELGLCLAQ